jgi:hypothetical protein
MNSADTKMEVFRPTIIERILIASRIPYEIGIVLLAVFVGPLGNFLYLYSVSNNAVSSFYGTSMSMYAGEFGFIEAIQSNWYSFAGNILWYAFLFYVAFIVRRLRMHLIKAEPELESLAPEKQKSVQEVFNIVSKVTPQLVITAVFLLVYATSVPDLMNRGELTIFSTPVYVFRSLFRSVLFGSVLWLYSGALLGLYRFGKLNLKFKSCHEDLMLGTKKLGSLSFSFSIAYFLGLTLFAAQAVLGGLASQTPAINVVAILVLVPAGMALFIAPLISTHNRMAEVKKAEIASTGKLLSEFIYRNPESARKKRQSAVELLALETTERRVMAIKTWPVENPLIGKLALVAISVAATLIARIIQILLNI